MKFLSTKTMSLLTAAALAFSLASCGTVSGTATDSAETTTVTQSAETQTDTSQSAATPGSKAIDGNSFATTEGNGNRQQMGGQPGPMEMKGTPGQITSIEGTTVTVALGQMGGGRGGMDNRQAPPDSQNSDQQTPPDLPSGQNTDGQSTD